MVQSEILGRTVKIITHSQAGTAFTIENEGRQYVVTAKHLFRTENYPKQTSVYFYIDECFQSFDVEVKYAEDGVDIAVLELNNHQYITKAYSNLYTNEGLVLGQDVFFCGFPIDIESKLGMIPGGDITIPLVKKACMSGMLNDGLGTMILDGINISGFSGGPVSFKKTGADEKTMRIMGVVSGYSSLRSMVFDADNKKTQSYINENSGIIIVSNIRYAVQIVENWD